MTTLNTLDDWRKSIKREAPRVGRPRYPYSHNLIGIALGAIEKHWGIEEVNRAIKDFKLEKKGWTVRNREKEKHE